MTNFMRSARCRKNFTLPLSESVNPELLNLPPEFSAVY
jgi:hypothetical protein